VGIGIRLLAVLLAAGSIALIAVPIKPVRRELRDHGPVGVSR
jgi:hypothetical protein